MSGSVLYVIGFVLALIYILLGFDDLLWDIFSFFKRFSYKNSRLDFSLLRKKTPKLLAVTIGAWNEAMVIGEVVENLIESIQYPKSMYHLFVGVYPNDLETIAVVSELEKRLPNVHMVVNCMQGPTTKAQNINYVISKIREFEKMHDWQFASITVHDAEDVVHPYELLVTNYLIDSHDALQFPVFPLMQLPRFGNFFKNITTGTYADEFAENHYTIMVGRCSTGAFVPSAGTGFALSRKAIESFDSDEILPNDSLTEDYKLSLMLYENELSLYYVLDMIPRVSKKHKIVYDYVATRSMFPTTFKTAVKQKSRWILGITMQSAGLRDVFKKGKIPFIGRYTIYKDLKAKISNLLVFVGYPIFVYFIVSLFIPLVPIYPKGTLSWHFSLIVTVMMIERQISRAIAIYHVYGLRSVFFSCLFPPLMPLRIVWGNVINLTATIRAYRQSLRNHKQDTRQKKNHKMKKYAWSKTDHTFLPKAALKRYHRTFGDILIEKGMLEVKTIKNILREKPDEVRIGKYLLQKELMTEEQMLSVLADVKHIPYANMGDFSAYDLNAMKDKIDLELIKALKVIPIYTANNKYVIAYCNQSPDNAQSILRETLGIEIQSVFTSEEMVNRGLEIMMRETEQPFRENIAYMFLLRNKINIEQYILIMNYAYEQNASILEVMRSMGLYKKTVCQ